MKYHFKTHKEKQGGFWAECIELVGCRTEAQSKQNLEKNMADALNLYLSEPQESKYIFPSPKKISSGKILSGWKWLRLLLLPTVFAKSD